MNIPLKQLRWYAAFHDEGHHLHVHMVCYSADGKSGFLTKQGVADIKSMLAKDIFEQDLVAVYQRQTQRRDELTENAGEVMAQLVTGIQTGTLENQRIQQLTEELAQRLRHCSGTGYSVLMKTTAGRAVPRRQSFSLQHGQIKMEY